MRHTLQRSDAPAGKGGSASGRSRRLRRGGGTWWTGLAFSAPFLILFAVFGLIPLAYSLFLSFTDMTLRDIQTPFAVNFVAFGQFAALFKDAAFLQSLRNTALYVIFGVPLTLALGLALALALDKGIDKFRSFFRVGFYTPVVTSIVAVAVVWRYILQPGDDGLLNVMLSWLGISGPDWLNSTTWALPSLIAMSVWRNTGNMMVILLAGLQSVPPETQEAAHVDGAGAWRTFWSVTFPQLKSTILLATIMLTIGFLQFFEEPFNMTRGGPLGTTTSVSMFVYNQFGYGKYAYGTAAAYVLFVIIAALSVLQFRALRERDN